MLSLIKDALDAIKEADAIVIGPGSLYTSIFPNLLVKKISTSVKKSKAIKIYVSNIMTQPGETDNFDVSDHVKVIKKYGGKEIVDYVIANSGEISEEIKSRYLEEGSTLAKLDIDNLKDLNVEICDDLIRIKNGTVKRNADKLAEILADTIMEKKLLYDRKKIIEYMYLSQRIKDSEKSNKEIGL